MCLAAARPVLDLATAKRAKPKSEWAAARSFARGGRRWAAIFVLSAACATARPAGPRRAEDLARPLEEGVAVLDAAGVRLIVKRVPHVKLVTAQLYFQGGVRNWTAADAGVERLALATAVAGGTETLPKEAFQQRLERLGSRLGSFANDDYSGAQATGLRERWRPTFDLLAGAVLHPALPGGEIERQRQLQLSALRQEMEEPDALLAKLSHERVYRGLPYENRAIGTVENLARFTRADLARHLTAIREKSRLLLVVVGDVDPKEIASWARGAFGSLPEGAYRPAPLAPPVFHAPALTVVSVPLPTTYVLAAFPAPSWRSHDLPAAIVAMSALREKLFEEVRTKRNLSYAPAAGLDTSGLGEGFLYVTAEQPNTTMSVMLDVLHAFQQGRIDATALAGDERIFLTHFLMGDETTGGLASLLGRAEVLGGDWRIAGRLIDGVKNVKPAQVSAFLKRYAKDLQTTILGDPARIDRGLFTAT